MTMTTIKTRGRQAKPTRVEVAAAWNRLRAAPEAGSVQASAALIALAEGRPFHLENTAA